MTRRLNLILDEFVEYISSETAKIDNNLNDPYCTNRMNVTLSEEQKKALVNKLHEEINKALAETKKTVDDIFGTSSEEKKEEKHENKEEGEKKTEIEPQAQAIKVQIPQQMSSLFGY